MLTVKIAADQQGDALQAFVEQFAAEVERTGKTTHTVAFAYPGGLTVKVRVRYIDARFERVVINGGGPRSRELLRQLRGGR